MGMLLFLGVATAGASLVVGVALVRNRPLSPPGFCAVLALFFGAAAASTYSYGWFSVALGGPIPVLCEDQNTAGADWTSVKQTFWPLRNACVYADGSTLEYVSLSITVLVCVLAGAAVVLSGAAALAYRRARRPSGGIAAFRT
ncbi:hypothetical protein [Streptomyces sp. NPDC058657]|uniref:hypothetical protein n=1 Tax=unclassified Streptomyces TaxID=2593676 RepID=UPI00366831A1